MGRKRNRKRNWNLDPKTDKHVVLIGQIVDLDKRKGDKITKANQRANRHYDDFRGEITQLDWDKIIRKFNYQCVKCCRAEPEITLTIDHVIPLCKGGRNIKSNIQPLCMDCNQEKGEEIVDYRKQWLRANKKTKRSTL